MFRNLRPSDRRPALARRVASWVLLWCLVWVGVSDAAPRKHDGGFFGRVSAGLGPAYSRSNHADHIGVSVDYDLALGWVFDPDVALHLTVFGWHMPRGLDPSRVFNHRETSMTLVVLAPGGTYYFNSGPAYFSTSLGMAVLRTEVEGRERRTDQGMGLTLVGGAEWYGNDTWSSGIALVFGAHFLVDGPDGHIRGWNAALRLNITRN